MGQKVKKRGTKTALVQKIKSFVDLKKFTLAERRKLAQHIVNCEICNHPDIEQIHQDIQDFLPFAVIVKRYGIGGCHREEPDRMKIRRAIAKLINHCRALKIMPDRKKFYENVISFADFSRASIDQALEAAKQLDRLEYQIVDNLQFTQIQVVYKHGDKMRENQGDVINVEAREEKEVE